VGKLIGLLEDGLIHSSFRSTKTANFTPDTAWIGSRRPRTAKFGWSMSGSGGRKQGKDFAFWKSP